MNVTIQPSKTGSTAIHLYFQKDFSFTIRSLTFSLCNLINNIYLEGTVSQILYLSPSFRFMTKTGNFLSFSVTEFSRFYKIKTKNSETRFPSNDPKL